MIKQIFKIGLIISIIIGMEKVYYIFAKNLVKILENAKILVTVGNFYDSIILKVTLVVNRDR